MNLKKLAVLSALTLTLVVGVLMFGGSKTRAAVGGPVCSVPSDYPTIQAAVNAHGCTTINVAPGTYNEQVTINRTLTLNGAQHGIDARTRVPASESIINHPCGPIQIIADNVVLDGFTVQGSNLDPRTFPACFGAGIWTNPGFSATQGGHQILNNIVQNNISGIELDSTCAANPTLVKFNLIQNNNNPGAGNGNGIQDNFVLCNATINSNKFVGNLSSGMLLFGPPVTSNGSNITVLNNEFAANGGAIALLGVTSSSIQTNNIHNSVGSGADIDIFGGVNGLGVSCNSLTMGAARAIQVEDPFGVGPNANVQINNNNISGYPTGLEEDTGGYTPVAPNSLDATNNWWGNPTGPTIVSNLGGTGEPIVDMDGVVNYKPFLTNPSVCAPCPNMNPGCTTTKKDCQAFFEKKEEAFEDKQKADKKAFDSHSHTKAEKKAFEDQQEAAEKAFHKQNEIDEKQCDSLPKGGKGDKDDKKDKDDKRDN